MSSIENKNFAFNEMMVHIPLCTHKEPENILVIGEVDEDLKTEVAKHKTAVTFGDVNILTAHNEKNIDVIIFVNVKIDEMLLANIDRILKADGIITFKTSAFGKSEQELKKDLSLVGANFWIAMPFSFGHSTAILASKKYHPTADLVLQVSDLLDDLSYYSTEVHHASFVFPSYIHKSLTGYAKR